MPEGRNYLSLVLLSNTENADLKKKKKVPKWIGNKTKN